MNPEVDPENEPIDTRTIPLGDGEETKVIAQQNTGVPNQIDIERTGDGSDEEAAIKKAANEQDSFDD